MTHFNLNLTYLFSLLCSLSLVQISTSIHAQNLDPAVHRIQANPLFGSLIEGYLQKEMGSGHGGRKDDPSMDVGEIAQQAQRQAIRIKAIQNVAGRFLEPVQYALQPEGDSTMLYIQGLPPLSLDTVLDSVDHWKVDSLHYGFFEEDAYFFVGYVRLEKGSEQQEAQGYTAMADWVLQKNDYGAALDILEEGHKVWDTPALSNKKRRVQLAMETNRYLQYLELSRKAMERLNFEAATDYAEQARQLFPRRAEAREVLKKIQAEQRYRKNPSRYLPQALSDNDRDLIEHLLELGAKPRAMPDGQPVLFHLMDKQAMTLYEELVDEGLKVNVKNKQGQTALIYALEQQRMAFVKALARHPDKDYTLVNADGENVLHALVDGQMEDSLRLELFKRALSKGASIQQKNKQVLTPLHRSVQENRSPLTALLLEAGADPQMTFPKTKLPLVYYAVRHSMEEQALLLLEAGAQVDYVHPEEEWSLLHVAVQERLEEVMRKLLEKGANPDLRGHAGNTPLHLAARKNSLFAVRLLKEHGGNIRIKNDAGKKPKDVAKSLGHVELYPDL